MTVLSVDLASRSWNDLGVVLLKRVRDEDAANYATQAQGSKKDRHGQRQYVTAAERQAALMGMALQGTSDHSLTDEFSAADLHAFPSPLRAGTIACEIIPMRDESSALEETHGILPEILAGRLNHLCTTRGVQVMLLDGPQAWKSEQNGLDHARVSERQLNTAAKTGLPGMVKPVTYRAFADFCVDVFDALCRRGWKRLATREYPVNPTDRVLVESYPHAAWKSLGLKPLPSKRRHKVSDLAECMAALKTVVPIAVNRPPNHDQLQAIVGGLAGLALTEQYHTPGKHTSRTPLQQNLGTRIVGQPPRREDGHWREGFIALPVAPEAVKIQWMD
jgi:hypothetical protein